MHASNAADPAPQGFPLLTRKRGRFPCPSRKRGPSPYYGVEGCVYSKVLQVENDLQLHFHPQFSSSPESPLPPTPFLSPPSDATMVVQPPSAINPDTGLPWNVRTDSSFGFVPTLAVCIVFVALFALTGRQSSSSLYCAPLQCQALTRTRGHAPFSVVAHLCQAFRYRVTRWWIPTVVTCGLVEVIGWSGRIWGSQNVWSQNPYIMQ